MHMIELQEFSSTIVSMFKDRYKEIEKYKESTVEKIQTVVSVFREEVNVMMSIQWFLHLVDHQTELCIHLQAYLTKLQRLNIHLP